MHAEREELVKRVFPQLRKLCSKRGLVFEEVDLRWGLTAEQKSEGKVLPICLAEVQRCRPYFIGLLGERYGWVPDEIPEDLLEREPWLTQYRDCSVTELEILHGVLNHPGMAVQAFFYFRDPGYIASLPEESRREYVSESAESATKLRLLKDRIRRERSSAQQGYGNTGTVAERGLQGLVGLISGLFPSARRRTAKRDSGRKRVLLREDYSDPQELGRLVLGDLEALIDRLYPAASVPDRLDLEAEEHEMYAADRARVYVGRKDYFERLDQHVAGDDQPLVVVGEPGLGKSALLANWALRYRDTHPPCTLILHFIGAAPASGDWAAMLRRILGEFNRAMGSREKLPDKPEDLRAAFANALLRVAQKTRIVLVLDGVNQLEDRDGALDLAWLPPDVPSNVRLVMSTLPGRALKAAADRNWPQFEVQPLTTRERRVLIDAYLERYSKKLSNVLIERIATTVQAGSPLYLRALLEELRVYGDHKTLEQRVEKYLAAQTSDGLYEKILERYEEDYEGERVNLVGEALTLIWGARRGLSESELLDLLARDGEPLARATWSPLFLALEQALLIRLGLIGFSHDYLRQAVEKRYLLQPDRRTEVHLRLARYFLKLAPTSRIVDEVPWQLAHAEQWNRLAALLANPDFLKAAWEANRYELEGYWAQVEERSNLTMVEGYREVLDHPDRDLAHTARVSALFLESGHSSKALSLTTYLAQHYRHTGDTALLGLSLADQALSLQTCGDLDGALALYREAEEICRRLGNVDGLWMLLNNLANLLQGCGELDRAMALYEEAEDICRRLHNFDGLRTSLGNRARIHQKRGDLNRAMALQKEVEQISRRLGSLDGLRLSLGNQATIQQALGHLDQAMELHKEEERICRQLGNPGITVSLTNQAEIMRQRGDLDQAMTLNKEAEDICRRLGNLDGLWMSLNNQALIVAARGDQDGAMTLHREVERICRQLGNPDGIRLSLTNQALILSKRGDLDQAMVLNKEAEDICRRLGNLDGLRLSLNNQAVIVEARGDQDGAMTLHKEAERICRQSGNPDGIRLSLTNQAEILRKRRDLDQAMVLNKEAEDICRRLGNLDGLWRSLNNQALIVAARGDQDGAMTLHREAERICRQVGNPDGIRLSLTNQAEILRQRRDLDQAMVLNKEAEDICRRLGNLDGLWRSLNNQALIVAARGDQDGAMTLHREAERICRQVGNLDGLSLSLGNQSLILKARGELDGAMALLKEQEQICRQMGDAEKLQSNLRAQTAIQGAGPTER